ncbi:hypothetical protein B296_00019681 [Ensete ventricosum]|uniref:Uncharacterized protein n=1 Tax=Ensete ventricosum TaxID=4639 RepID=A0A427A580_ENSVE|nr:hypothetical protein B296_00019681 [Ensete ventricosum]
MAPRPLLDCGPSIGLACRGAVSTRDWSADYDVNLSFNWVGQARLSVSLRSPVGVVSSPLDIMIEVSLGDQGREEPFAQFVNRFATETRAILDAHPSLVIQAFLMGIRLSKLLWSLVKKPSTTVLEMMQRAYHFIVAKTLIHGKREEQKHPRTEQSQGSTSRSSRRRIEGLDFSHSRPPTTPLNSTRIEILFQIRGK